MTKYSATVPRLDATAFKTITEEMKINKELTTLLQSEPTYKQVLDTVRTNMRRAATAKLSGRKQELYFILSRFIHLHLIHSILVLFKNEPDCLVILDLPYRHGTVELFSERDDHDRPFYLVDVQNNHRIQKQFSFWNRDDFVLYLIGLFMGRMPKTINVLRSSVNVSACPIDVFIRHVEESFGRTEVPKRLVRLYDKRYEQRHP